MSQTAVEFDNVGFTYDGNTFVLDGIDFKIQPGEFVAILGGNGSGKSTLARHVNALLVPDTGEVRTLEQSTGDKAALYFIRSNAGMVFQNPDDQIVASLIENDVAFGPENLGVPAQQLRHRVDEALEHVGLKGFERHETATLSGGQKQRVAIAGALAMQPEILVLDEASSMLDPRGRSGLMKVCERLHSDGMTIVMITHFMEEAAHAQRVIVLDAGHMALDGATDEVLKQVRTLELLSLDIPFSLHMSELLESAGIPTGMHVRERELIDVLCAFGQKRGVLQVPFALEDLNTTTESEGSDDALPPSDNNKKPCVSFENVWFSYGNPQAENKRKNAHKDAQPAWGSTPEDFWALQDISFDFYEGEFLGIAGHTGSGKSTLIQHMNGLLNPTRGRVLVDGKDIARKSEAAVTRGKVGLVFQYPEHQLFAATVFDDVAFGPRNMGMSTEEVDVAVRDAMRQVGLDRDELGQVSPFELSGGQQRRVAFAGVLAMHPKILVLDEPMAGLDPAAHHDFMELVEQLNKRDGLSVVMVSHNMDDLAKLCDRVLVMDRGCRYKLGTPQHVFSNAEDLRSIGLSAPHAQRMATTLQGKGFPLPRSFYNDDCLASDIAGILNNNTSKTTDTEA